MLNNDINNSLLIREMSSGGGVTSRRIPFHERAPFEYNASNYTISDIATSEDIDDMGEDRGGQEHLASRSVFSAEHPAGRSSLNAHEQIANTPRLDIEGARPIDDIPPPVINFNLPSQIGEIINEINDLLTPCDTPINNNYSSSSLLLDDIRIPILYKNLLNPDEKINQLKKLIENMNNDTKKIHDIIYILKDLAKNKDLHLEYIINSLESLLIKWNNKMFNLISLFKENVYKLKKYDDRINTSLFLNLYNIGEDYDSQWLQLFEYYYEIFTNLKCDIVLLTDAKIQISKYNKLRLELDGAIKTIDVNINNIIEAATDSLINLQVIIDSINIKDCDLIE